MPKVSSSNNNDMLNVRKNHPDDGENQPVKKKSKREQRNADRWNSSFVDEKDFQFLVDNAPTAVRKEVLALDKSKQNLVTLTAELQKNSAEKINTTIYNNLDKLLKMQKTPALSGPFSAEGAASKDYMYSLSMLRRGYFFDPTLVKRLDRVQKKYAPESKPKQLTNYQKFLSAVIAEANKSGMGLSSRPGGRGRSEITQLWKDTYKSAEPEAWPITNIVKSLKAQMK